MSTNFNLYSQYYDLLYKDKDYAAETDYIVSLIRTYSPNSKSILELGAGTGIHASLLAQQGFELLGLERSAEMVKIASKRASKNCNFKISDITDFATDRPFDVAISLFHVISYLTTNQELLDTFTSVNQSLPAGGIFIFDVWHSPAVYHQVPEKRTKVLANDQIRVTRNATPVLYPELNVVEVNYDISVDDLKSQKADTFSEQHRMRHFSQPEMALLAQCTGFELLHAEEFLSREKPSTSTWGVCYICKKI